MNTTIFNRPASVILATVLLVLSANYASAQTTGFTYQGKLSEAGTPANGSYDFEFALYDGLTGGTAQGLPVQRLNVTVTNGIFTVQLDFGNQFNGANRFLDISVKTAGSAAFTPLTPRQEVTSNPYAIKSLNASTADGLSVACVSCVTSSQIQSLQGSQVTGSITGSQISGAIPVASVPAGSSNYVQNTNALQAASNFNISGNGTAGGTLSAGAITSATQYNIGFNRVLSIPGISNVFAGSGAGAANVGNSNAFFGTNAGATNSSGNFNSFFGTSAGGLNTTGFSNAFFGSSAGAANTTGRTNAFFGTTTGQSNTTGVDNSYFGIQAGFSNQTGNNNSFFGRSAGLSNTASDNSFFGMFAGESNTTGTRNSFFGRSAGDANVTGSDNSFFGYSAGLANTASSNSFFGSKAGDSNTAGNLNVFFGTSAGQTNTTGSQNAFLGANAGTANTTGVANTFIGRSAGSANTNGSNNTYIGAFASGAAGISNATAIGANATATQSNGIYIGTSTETVFVPGSVLIFGRLTVLDIALAGNLSVCRTVGNELANCSSSLRYKTNISPFSSGLGLVNRLRPITFDWKAGGMRDFGLGAEEVAAIEPLLVTYNKAGQVEGVKYDRLGVVLLNAVKEQQTQIQQQQKQIKQQQILIDGLRQLVCQTSGLSDICKENK